MDVTSVTLGKQVRDDLRDYRDSNEYANYNEAIKALLEGDADADADADAPEVAP